MADAAGRGVRRCPRCGAEGYVIDSRLNAAGEVTGMRFNVDKYFSGNGWYSMMEPEELAFHDATGWKIQANEKHKQAETQKTGDPSFFHGKFLSEDKEITCSAPASLQERGFTCKLKVTQKTAGLTT